MQLKQIPASPHANQFRSSKEQHEENVLENSDDS